MRQNIGFTGQFSDFVGVQISGTNLGPLNLDGHADRFRRLQGVPDRRFATGLLPVFDSLPYRAGPLRTKPEPEEMKLAANPRGPAPTGAKKQRKVRMGFGWLV